MIQICIVTVICDTYTCIGDTFLYRAERIK